jgi:hypothetical protein
VSHGGYCREAMETVLGLLGLAVFIIAVIAFAAGVTFIVIKVTPAEKPKNAGTTAS